MLFRSAVVSLETRTAPPLKLCHQFIGDLVHGPEEGPIPRVNKQYNVRREGTLFVQSLLYVPVLIIFFYHRCKSHWHQKDRLLLSLNHMSIKIRQ